MSAEDREHIVDVIHTIAYVHADPDRQARISLFPPEAFSANPAAASDPVFPGAIAARALAQLEDAALALAAQDDVRPYVVRLCGIAIAALPAAPGNPAQAQIWHKRCRSPR
jgi:hypothetical protein